MTYCSFYVKTRNILYLTLYPHLVFMEIATQNVMQEANIAVVTLVQGGHACACVVVRRVMTQEYEHRG